MPAERLQDTPVRLRLFDVVGQDSDNVEQFVRHVGLALQPQAGLTRRSPLVRLVHMGPPLTRDHADGPRPADAVATVELTADELLQIQVFLDELNDVYEAEKARAEKQYVIRPHVAEPDEKTPFPRFNCAGFVVEAYRDAGIDLVETEETLLPPVSLGKLKQAYPDQAEALEREAIRRRCGLLGNGPWPVLLAGYVICAMARSVESIRSEPYQPQAGDEYFPSRPLINDH